MLTIITLTERLIIGLKLILEDTSFEDLLFLTEISSMVGGPWPMQYGNVENNFKIFFFTRNEFLSCIQKSFSDLWLIPPFVNIYLLYKVYSNWFQHEIRLLKIHQNRMLNR